jgi:hypothetical protein
MRRPAALAFAVWALLAAAVFSVTFDWQTRMAGFTFIESQMDRRARGVPPATIEDGFRPLVGDAARRAALWMLVVVAAGSAGMTFASKAR